MDGPCDARAAIHGIRRQYWRDTSFRNPVADIAFGDHRKPIVHAGHFAKPDTYADEYAERYKHPESYSYKHPEGNHNRETYGYRKAYGDTNTNADADDQNTCTNNA